jgi:uncharacterized membrane protein
MSERSLPENVLAAVAYVTFIPPLVYLLREPFKSNQELRFHSYQCLLVWAAVAAMAVVLKVVALSAFLLATLIGAILLIGLGILWLVLMLKAYLGERFALPVIGGVAEGLAKR